MLSRLFNNSKRQNSAFFKQKDAPPSLLFARRNSCTPVSVASQDTGTTLGVVVPTASTSASLTFPSWR
jgi:hypothetical protein